VLTPNTRRLLAGATVAALGVALLSGLAPYASGLLGAPMLYVIWEPVQRRLSRRMPAVLSALLVLALTVVLLVVPGVLLTVSLVDQAQSAVQGALASPVLDRVRGLQFGSVTLEPYVASAGQNLVAWLGGNALSLLGAATRAILNLVFLLFGLYFLLINPGRAWAAVEPYIPFSQGRAGKLRQGFIDVTLSTVIGTGVIAVLQGTLIGLAFLALGLSNAVFWGTVTAALSILPLVGSGMIWLPAAVGLFVAGSTGKAVALVIWGVVVVGNIDNVIRPIIYNRFAKIHPMITLVGAIVGVEQMGFIGLILGPLAISYFFELLRMYSEEYVTASWPAVPQPESVAPSTAGIIVSHDPPQPVAPEPDEPS
jgi:predicted PurR-regulated permease PerM